MRMLKIIRLETEEHTWFFDMKLKKSFRTFLCMGKGIED
jgi:hypothetical protein